MEFSASFAFAFASLLALACLSSMLSYSTFPAPEILVSPTPAAVVSDVVTLVISCSDSGWL